MSANKFTAALLAGAIVILTVGSALGQDRCRLQRLERFLDKRVFELSADQKISLYAEKLVRYYDDRNISRTSLYRTMRAWEQRWPERIYKFLRVTDFQKTEEGDACKVTFDYRFLAYSPDRDAVSAGIGTTTLVLADLEGEGLYQIIGEFGDVRCRGLQRFARSRC